MKKTIVGVIASVVIFAVFIELLSLAWYFASTWYSNGRGELFYTSDRPHFSVEGDGDQGLITLARFHPFFGWVNRSASTNNHGFFSPIDYPYTRSSENEYIIGVFGGSVAGEFYQFGKERLVEHLRRHPSWAGREITVLNFSMAGYKQPQQLLLLNYYLVTGQAFDLVINIDGFNEVALSNLNSRQGIDIAMPSMHHIGPMIGVVDGTTLTGEQIESLFKIQRYRARANRIGQLMDRANVASTYFVLKQLYKIAFNRYALEKVAFQQLESNAFDESMIRIYSQGQVADSTLFESIASQWVTSSTMMHRLLAGKQIPYVHVLQPNQYHSKKTFEPREAAIALTEGHKYRAGVEKGYPFLIDKFEVLWQNGVRFYSALEIFDDELGAIYKDDCCHYNQRGIEILADFVAEAIMRDGGEP
jgi:hypothetical protein